MMPSRELSGISDRRAADPRREAKIEAMFCEAALRELYKMAGLTVGSRS